MRCYFRNRSNEKRTDQSNWFNRPFGQVVFDAADPVATTIFLQENEAPVKDLGFEQQFRATSDELQSYGLNAAWELGDRVTITADGHYSIANSRPDAPNGTSSTLVALGAPVIASHSVDYSGEIPVQVQNIDDSFRGNNNGVLDSGDVGSQVGRTNASSQRQRIYEGRLDLEYRLGEDSMFNFGGQYINTEMTSARVQTQQQLGDWGIGFPGDVNQLAPGAIKRFCLTCKFSTFDPQSTGSSLTAFRGNAVDLYRILSAAYAADGNPSLAGNQPGNPAAVNRS